MNELEAALKLLAWMLVDGRTGALFILLVIAAVSDYRTLRIPNWLTASGTAYALIYTALSPFHRDEGLLWAVYGMLIGFSVMLLPYLMRIMGAGDVKLMAMVGAFLGLNGIFGALLYVMATGGLSAILYTVARRKTGQLFSNVGHLSQNAAYMTLAGMLPTLDVHAQSWKSVGRMPYGVSIATGTVLYMGARQLGFA